MTKQRKAELDHFIGYAVNEGCLDEEIASGMTYKEKDDYLDWSDFMANSQEEEEIDS